MHRHGYKGRKFHRETDQRTALMKGLADSLVKYEVIETTLPKAKELVPYVERLITKAKKADLHNRRQVISALQTLQSANKLVDELAPKLKGRNSGHLRITKTTTRRGDNAMQAKVSFIFDEIVAASKPAKEEVKVEEVKEAKVVKTAAKKPATKKTTVEKEAK